MLNDRQQKFVDEYLKDLNATQAAVRAGYSAKTAYSIGERLLRNVEVKAAIDKAKAKRAEAVKIDQQWVLIRLIEVAERCMQGQELFDKEGHSLGEWKFEHSGANKALELIGKHLGMFEDSVAVKLPDGGAIANINVNTIPTDQLERLVDARLQAARRANGGKS